MAAVTLLTACGAGNGRFRIEGRFRNLNRGEFYVYSPDGGTQGRDTIQVADGRFSYNVPLSDKATFILIFPNFSELVVFGDNGKVAKLSGDVSHMKEIEVSGSDDNELMTKFRMSANRMAPPEVKKAVADFVGEHPASPVSMYLVDRYYIRADDPDYAAAAKLLKTMLKADPTNGRTALLLKQTETLKPSAIGAKLPQFAATDTDGKAISLKNLNGKVNVVSAWASWSYDSQNIQRWLRRYKTAKGNDLAVVSLCLDGDKATCLRELKADSINWPTVCDGLMWDTPLMARFGLATVPGNIVLGYQGLESFFISGERSGLLPGPRYFAPVWVKSGQICRLSAAKREVSVQTTVALLRGEKSPFQGDGEGENGPFLRRQKLLFSPRIFSWTGGQTAFEI